MKTFDRKDVFSWSNAEEAKQYIGEKGYFADGAFENIDDWQLDVLDEIYLDSDVRTVFQAQSSFYGLFLPEDKIKEVEEPKKWRAFRTFEEFVLAVGLIGCHIRYRFKDDISNEFFAVIVGFNYEAQTVTINNSIYSFKELFNKFEFYKNQKWQPLGVEE